MLQYENAYIYMYICILYKCKKVHNALRKTLQINRCSVEHRAVYNVDSIIPI